MYLFAILSSLICIQLISVVSSEKDTSETRPSSQLNILIPRPRILVEESAEEGDYVPRSTSFLRFGRELPPSFLRFGRNNANSGTFLRFGRQTSPPISNNFLRFGKKGEFLRFG